jgi:hypothetical protein
MLYAPMQWVATMVTMVMWIASLYYVEGTEAILQLKVCATKPSGCAKVLHGKHNRFRIKRRLRVGAGS